MPVQTLSSNAGNVVQVEDSQVQRELDTASSTQSENDVDKPVSDAGNSMDEAEALAKLSWEEFEARYTADLKAASEKEDEIRSIFDNYAESFDIWAQTGSEKDNERGQKRLKTRSRLVQLSEQDLERKQQHYKTVVEAFKNALTLLKSPADPR